MLWTTHSVSNVTVSLNKPLFILLCLIHVYSRCIRIVKYISAGIDVTLTILKLIIIWWYFHCLHLLQGNTVHADLRNFQYSWPLEYKRRIILLSSYGISNSVDSCNYFILTNCGYAMAQVVKSPASQLEFPRSRPVRCFCSCRGENISPNCCHQQAYYSLPRWYMSMERHGGIIFTEEDRRTRRKTCPNATLSTTNLAWT
jgi:hypothetical protein